MIITTLMWSVAVADAQTYTLDNGVEVSLMETADATGWVDVGWFSPHGSASGAPSATAVALLALEQGTHSTPRDALATRWVQTTRTVPTRHLCATDAGAVASLPADALAAWAWLTSDALADPIVADLPAARAAATEAFAAVSTPSADRAPSPWSWGAADQSATVDEAVIAQQITRLRDPNRLHIWVRGDVSAAAVHEALDTAFARLPVPETPSTAPFATVAPRTGRTVRTQHTTGPERVLIRFDIARGPVATALQRALDQRVDAALDRVASDASVRLDTAAPIWTLELDARPTPGRASAVEPAWDAFIQTLAGEGLPAVPAPAATRDTVVRLAHAKLRVPAAEVPVTPQALSEQLGSLVTAARYVQLDTAVPDDPELDALRREYGELTAELVRIRLRTVHQTPQADLEALLAELSDERARMPARLRPALDLVIARAEARQ